MHTSVKFFCDSSSITIDEYYQSLKYAESTSGNEFHHRPLKYTGEEGAEFYSKLAHDIDHILKESVSLSSKLCENYLQGFLAS